MPARVHQFLCLSDNYGVLVHDPETRSTAAIDAPDAASILAALDAQGWELTDILVTHHHADHTQGLPGLKRRFPQARVVGPAKEREKIEAAMGGPLGAAVAEDDFVMVGSLKARVIETPGHTSGHVSFYFKEHDLLFVGDTLFALGCGRNFEEPARVLYRSLMKLARLPGSVQVYCGHEYTGGNARFAAAIETGNGLLADRVERIEATLARGEFTLPTTISLERATNPFLRVDEAEIKRAMGLSDADGTEVFAALRERKSKG